MADKNEFLKALDEHIGIVKTWLEEIGLEINEYSTKVSELQKKRQEKLEESATVLLPDLKETSIDALNYKIPDFITKQKVTELLNMESKRIKKQIEELLLDFDPEAFESKQAELEQGLEKEQGDQKIVASLLDDFERVKGLRELTDCGYGTDAYPRNILQTRYYLDWKRADEIVAILKKKDWSKVRQEYQELQKSAQMLKNAINRMREQIRVLSEKSKNYSELKDALQNVDGTILEKLRIKLKAELDSLESLPDWLQEIIVINDTIKEFQTLIIEQLQPRREGVSKQLSQMQQLRVEASQSQTRRVPNKYINQLRERNRQIRRGAYKPQSIQHISIHNDNWLFPYIYYTTMFEYFHGSSHEPAESTYNEQVTETRYGS